MAAKPIYLKATEVAKKALEAYRAGKLSAQGPTPACRYRDDSGRPCAIGVALSAKDALRFDKFNEPGIWSIVRNGHGVVFTDSVDDLDALQQRHDHWVRSETYARPIAEARFLATAKRIAGEEV